MAGDIMNEIIEGIVLAYVLTLFTIFVWKAVDLLREYNRGLNE